MNYFKCKFIYSTEKRDKHESYCNFPSCRTDCLYHGDCDVCDNEFTAFCINCHFNHNLPFSPYQVEDYQKQKQHGN